ncbi:hypothetical protein C7974DRAFT_396843 [Boeremia exigua]|uniref:uncharacterized protein n=1 Tax=Boeremia exigua TaxID=749465 RepID=UPI001E8DE5D9|nr:uncharacterized protein C7974DRAFT_396843 [Boeremia exigua]KAH6625859.1 hypothetical protein C7974DRAFT_396843 [Boeremia exigua]
MNWHIPIPMALQWALDFVYAVANFMFHLCKTQNVPDALADILFQVYDRKERYKQRKCKEEYTCLVETMYKKCVREVLEDLFAKWNPINTQEFIRGIDKALTRTQWRYYPLTMLCW